MKAAADDKLGAQTIVFSGVMVHNTVSMAGEQGSSDVQ